MLNIYQWSKTDKQTKKMILDRAMFDIASIQDYVSGWIETIQKEGDEAIVKYTRKFDNKDFNLKDLRVKKSDIKKAYKVVEPKVIEVIERQISLSRQNALSKSRQETVLKSFIPGVQVGYKITPIESVGLAVPAGQVPLPSVMQILAVTAKAAGVERVIACFPPTGDYPEMLIAADLAGVDEAYRVGGIAGIVAMAYGTETIKPVLKIAGPGSIYTQAAKMLVFGKVVIDMVAGPSEAVILADAYANPTYCAADILARAEHAPDAAGVLITYSEKLAQETKKEIERQIIYLKRSEIIEKSLNKYSCAIVVKDWQEAIELTNEYSPEHLEILVDDPFAVLPQIKNAGSIFLGNFAPVAVGDYASGTNHILPTGFWSKMASAVSIETFQKSSEVQYITREGLENLEEIVDVVSGIEKLDAHWNSVNVRINKKKRLWDQIKERRVL
ncbi:histidinol dehydrogenase [Candidatus Gottesmanbacteria bacterium RIFCSPLOWO2_01_FULL_39_12b]|uniref:Histidinol dehydrogenase n=1 Tax=Candidatus Gottesmanbacteria bacterium RIFCSPLOWO2_01_FULL_39_12b TaxID=1798388 RepID=A0A1F6ARM6_9BACT|nr:MAG: histidinol dehydrogenase [Candidatus Gottesmanbacteria bacterium RIFCSPLOWO2_01_FULL_39_12b]